MELSEYKDAAWFNNGQSALTGSALKLYKALDETFLNWGRDFEAKEYLFPSFIQAKELAKLDYFRSFPHLVTFPTALKDEESNLKNFIEGGMMTAEGQMKFAEMQPTQEVLTPAACYHFYILLQGQTLHEPRYLTTRCTCYRRENHYVQLRRQWNFSMRELVCIGTSDQVKSFLEHYRKKIDGFMKEINLPVEWEMATDPFFNPAQNPKYLMQRLDPIKNELLYKAPGAKDPLAISSINFHRNYFGEAYKLKAGGEEAYSGCVAFGIERWIFSFLSHYGMDSNRWPQLKGLSL